MALRWQSICVDCTDPASLGHWWAELLGWVVTEEDDDVVIQPPGGHDGPEILFGRDDTPRRDKVRIHIDLRPDDQAAEVARALALGATHVDIGQGDETWVVLADPEGNEFCILQA